MEDPGLYMEAARAGPGMLPAPPVPVAAMPERTRYEAPRLVEGSRQKMADALYQEFYANALPREEYDRQTAMKSDLQLANAAYDAFYKDQLPRADFNAQIGLTSARGSTQDAVVQGMTLGFGDEIAGAGAAAGQLIARGVRSLTGAGNEGQPTAGQAYSQARDTSRENAEVFRQNNPYLGRALEFAGGVPAGAARIAGAAAPTFGRVVAESTGMGAAAGFGDAEGGVTNRLVGAGVGGALGAGLAAAVPAALTGLQKAGGALSRALGLGNADDTAANLLLRAFQQDGLTPAEISKRLADWQMQGGKPEMLFDLAGENTRRLARTAAGRMGPGTEQAVTALAERQAGQAGRVADDAAAGLGQNADEFFTRRSALIEQRRTQAAPWYERAWQIEVKPDEYANVSRFVDDKIGQDALRKGLRVIELEHLARGEAFDTAAYGVQRVNGELVPVEGATPNMRLLDAVKRGFDEIVEGFRDPTSGRLNLNQYGRAVNDARASYRNELADMFWPYRRALEAYSGPSGLMDAMARGRNVFNMRDSEAVSAASSIKPGSGDADAFRLGVAQAIQERIASRPDGADAVKAIFGSPAKRALLRRAFPDQAAFEAFEASMQREAAMYRNAQFVSPRTGSQTELRGNEAGDVAGLAGQMAMASILPGGSMLGTAGRFLADRAAGARGVTPEVAGALVSRLYTDNPAAISGTLQRAGGDLQAQMAARLAASRRAGMLYPGVSAGLLTAQ